MNLPKILIAGIFTITSIGFATTSFAQTICIDGSVEGGDCIPVPNDNQPASNGDNGWGNGADTTNNGSFSGATSTSKSSNGSDRTDGNAPAGLEGKFDEGR